MACDAEQIATSRKQCEKRAFAGLIIDLFSGAGTPYPTRQSQEGDEEHATPDLRSSGGLINIISGWAVHYALAEMSLLSGFVHETN